MTTVWTLLLIAFSAVWFGLGRVTGRTDGYNECLDDMERRQREAWDRLGKRIRAMPVYRPDARPVEARTTEELVFRLVDEGQRMMEDGR